MKITVTNTAQNLPKILGGKNYSTLVNDKEKLYYKFTIQNLWRINVFIDNWITATPDTWYVLAPGNNLEIEIYNLHKLTFVTDQDINDDIRIITT